MVQIRLPENSKIEKGNYYKDKTEIKYRPVTRSTLTNDVQYYPPQERVY